MIPTPAPEWVRRVESRAEGLIGHRVCEATGIKWPAFRALAEEQRLLMITNYRQQALERLRVWVAKAEVRVRICPEALERVLEDGLYKTLFVTGTSRGTANVEVRRHVETTVLNVPPATAAGDRPVYGYLSGSSETGAIEQWASVVLGLRPIVVERVTFVLGDTINGTLQGNRPAFAPARLTDPNLLATAVDRNVLTSSSMAAACYEGFGYAEAHVYGRVPTGDVARAVFTGAPPSAELHRRLLESGIAPLTGRDHLL
jgi:hypothetical protein